MVRTQKMVAVVVDDAVEGVGDGDDFEDGSFGLVEVFDEEIAVGAGAFDGLEDEVAAVVGDGCAYVEFFVFGAVEGEFVFALRRAQFVEEDFVEVVGGFQGSFVHWGRRSLRRRSRWRL